MSHSSVIRSAHISALYLFDVAESVELEQLSALLHTAAQPARLASKRAMPSYVRYQAPPMQMDGAALGVEPLDGFDVRFEVFDYGVVSLVLTRAFSGTWDELTQVAHRLSGDESLEAGAKWICREFLTRIRSGAQRSAR